MLTLSGLAGLPLAEILGAFAGHPPTCSGRNITELPPQIEQLASLRALDVSNTGITAFPPELRNCTALRHVGLSMYKFRDKKALKAQLPKGRWKQSSDDAYVRTA